MVYCKETVVRGTCYGPLNMSYCTGDALHKYGPRDKATFITKLWAIAGVTHREDAVVGRSTVIVWGIR